MPEAAKEFMPEAANGYGAARGYTSTHPPFEAGNLAAVTHGARSERIVAQLAADLDVEVLEAQPWLDDPAYQHSRLRYGRFESVARKYYARMVQLLETEGIDAVTDSLFHRWVTAERNAARQAERLGMDPAARTALAKDSALAHHFAADDRAALLEQGRRIVESRAAPAAVEPATDRAEAVDGHV